MSIWYYPYSRLADGKTVRGTPHLAEGMQYAYAGAYRELKKGCTYVLIVFHNDMSNTTAYHTVFTDKTGIFGKKGAIIAINSAEDGTFPPNSIYRNGRIIHSDGGDVYISDYMRSKKKNSDAFSIPDDWHPFGL